MAYSPISSQDNGDGSYTFLMPSGQSMTMDGQDAQMKHQEMMNSMAQMDPYVESAALEKPQYLAGPGTGIDDGWRPTSSQIQAETPVQNSDAGTPVVTPRAPQSAPSPMIQRSGNGASGLLPSEEKMSQVVIPDADKKAISDASDQSIVAQKHLAQAQYNENEQTAEFKKNSYARMDEMEGARQAAEKGRQVKMDEHMATLERLTQRARDIKDVDPDRYWANKSMGGRIASSFAVALSEYANAKLGRANSVANAIDKDIDRDIQAQKDNIAKARGDIQDQKGLLGEFRQNFSDQREAEKATKIAYLDGASRQLDLMVENNKNPKLAAQANAIQAELELKKAKEQADLNKIAVERIYKRPTGTGAGAGTLIDENGQPIKYAEDVNDAQKLGKDMQEGPGTIRSGISEIRGILDKKDGLSGIGPVSGRVVPDLLAGEEGRDNRRRLLSVAASFMNANKLGHTDSDLENAKTIIGNINSTEGDLRNAVSMLERSAKRQESGIRSEYGAVPNTLYNRNQQRQGSTSSGPRPQFNTRPAK